MGLPSPSQVWSHATNSQAKLSQALRDPTLTAIEADILIGKLLPDTERNAEEDSGVRDSDGYCPIMAHPPDRQSNLSLRNFLEQVTHSEIRIIKLDFKEIDAVQPSLDILKSILSQRKSEITVILNADILAGPGARNVPVNVAPGAFFEICNDFLSSVGESQGAVASSFGLSLGFHVAPSESDHYTVDDSDAMHSLVCTSNVGEKAGQFIGVFMETCSFKVISHS